MPGTERRVQEGQRALALAFTVGLAQRALHRTPPGAPIPHDGIVPLARLASLFRDATFGIRIIVAFDRGEAQRLDHRVEGWLTALQLIEPVVGSLRESGTPSELSVNRIAGIAESAAASRPLAALDRDVLADTLRKLVCHATAQGRELLESAESYGVRLRHRALPR